MHGLHCIKQLLMLIARKFFPVVYPSWCNRNQRNLVLWISRYGAHSLNLLLWHLHLSLRFFRSQLISLTTSRKSLHCAITKFFSWLLQLSITMPPSFTTPLASLLLMQVHSGWFIIKFFTHFREKMMFWLQFLICIWFHCQNWQWRASSSARYEGTPGCW